MSCSLRLHELPQTYTRNLTGIDVYQGVHDAVKGESYLHYDVFLHDTGTDKVRIVRYISGRVARRKYYELGPIADGPSLEEFFDVDGDYDRRIRLREYKLNRPLTDRPALELFYNVDGDYERRVKYRVYKSRAAGGTLSEKFETFYDVDGDYDRRIEKREYRENHELRRPVADGPALEYFNNVSGNSERRIRYHGFYENGVEISNIRRYIRPRDVVDKCRNCEDFDDETDCQDGISHDRLAPPVYRLPSGQCVNRGTIQTLMNNGNPPRDPFSREELRALNTLVF